MPGPPPKHASTRARRNKVAGAKQLKVVPDLEVPTLPADAGIEWHPLTLRWWNDIWSSPMAPEFDASDIHGLYMLATLVQAFWSEPSTQLASEIRLQRQCFGLTPIDRRRLQWEISRGEAAEDETSTRRNARKPTPAKKSAASPLNVGKKAADPRSALA